MKRIIISSFVAAGLAAAAPGAFAQGMTHASPKPAASPAAGGMPMAKPAPEMSNLKVFGGTWTCDADVPAGPMGPAHKTHSTVKSRTDMGGFWQSGTVSMTSAGMPPFEGTFHMTYDPGGKKYVMLWVDNMGGWSQETATGWEGDKMVFTGEGVMNGQKTPARDTFTKKGETELVHLGEMQMNGQWVSFGDENCKKAAGAAPAKKK